MLKYADVIKKADAPGKGLNSSFYKRTGVDPAKPGAWQGYYDSQRRKINVQG